MDKLTEKIQVLLSPKDVELLNNIMLGKAIKIGKRPTPLSTFIRAILRKFIEEETSHQYSFTEEHVNEILKTRIKDLYKKKLNTKNN